MGAPLEYTTLAKWGGNVLLGPTGHLPYKAASQSLRNITDLPNTQKFKKLGKMMRLKNMFSMREQKFRKRTK